ncbi:MAG TPA: Rne/Rng family ribonuclease [Alphaproteobacteria bacterium]
MIDEILSATTSIGTVIALREEGATVELIVEPANAATEVGGVHLGRVTRIVPAMNAAFVEIGLERAGFLPLPESLPNEAPLHAGAAVVVQVAKDAQGGKGAALTLNVALPGRHLVYAPRQPGVAVSRRITDEGERARLESAMGAIAKEGEGFILRTAAEKAEATALAADAEDLRAAWAEIKRAAARATPPARLWGEQAPLARVLRDQGHAGLTRIVADSDAALEAARREVGRSLPMLAGRIDAYRDSIPLLDRFGVMPDIDAALSSRVGLPGGGFLYIEPTQALTAIDVNSGRHNADVSSGPNRQAETILAVNLEAAREIARQIRLRNLSGLIVIDFVHMSLQDDRSQVLEALRVAMAGDPTFARLGGFSPLGLVEIARKRGRPPLHELLTDACKLCDGRGRTDLLSGDGTHP